MTELEELLLTFGGWEEDGGVDAGEQPARWPVAPPERGMPDHGLDENGPSYGLTFAGMR
ncbi:hypothetical protein ACIBQX_43300 [Nonomuraea sp. NPDC049714]|uniref:hypothetical protein n=1 Tax=Nonomuraea sp. NPDC049714 TaxID=3364357 RepID=UPI00378FEF23